VHLFPYDFDSYFYPVLLRLCLRVRCFPWEGYQPNRKTPHSWRTSLSLLVWPRDLWNTRRQTKIQKNLINHLERLDNTRLPKHALNYKPRGRRDRGRPRKRWQCVDAGTGQTT